MPKMSTRDLLDEIVSILVSQHGKTTTDSEIEKAIALLDEQRPAPEPVDNAREMAQSICDYVLGPVLNTATSEEEMTEDLFNQGRSAHVAGMLGLFRARILDEAAARAVKYVKGNLITWELEIMDEHCKEIRAAVRGKE